MQNDLHNAIGILVQMLDFKYELFIEFIKSINLEKADLAEKRAQIIHARLSRCWQMITLLPQDRLPLKIAVAFIEKYEVAWLRFINDFIQEENAALAAITIRDLLRSALSVGE